MADRAGRNEGTGFALAAAIAERDRAALAMVRTALRDRRVALALQPVVFAATPHKAAFHEGLIRLLDDHGREVPASAFIGAAESTGLGRLIDCTALELGLEALRLDPGLRLAVNLSPRTIGHARWSEILAQGLARDATVAERLILELTEQSAMQVPGRVIGFILDMQRQGISLALDDFGAGQTAFRHLRDFGFDIVKIDRRFVTGVDRDPDNQVLVRALAMIARQFEMMVVAEGVERTEEGEWLAAQGVDSLQGYLFGRPEMIRIPSREAVRKRA